MSAADLITRLRLQPHPEGGHFRETFRSAQRGSGGRSASTAIWYLLESGDFSSWHRVSSDEVWHHYDGAPLVLWMLTDAGLERTVLGRDWAAGERPQAVVPAGVWQAAEPLGAFALCGCTVAPGFEFADFELGSRAQLLERFPLQPEAITRLTRA